MEEKEQKNPGVEAKNMLKRLQENSESLHISRIPPETKKGFVEWAKREFCGDFGMALKWLWDDLPKGDLNTILDVVQNHEERLLAIEQQGVGRQEEQPETRKTVDGKKHGVGKNE